jgi:hypothetical protein
MPNRSNLLISIRPVIEVFTENSTIFESFQSSTLRPILKLQNQTLLSLFAVHLLENKIKLSEQSTEKQDETIHTILKKNMPFKNLSIGLVVGHFTEEELQFYNSNKSEITKRIVELVIKRLSDQKEKLY